MRPLFLASAILLLLVSTTHGQTYPTKPIRMVVPSGAGSSPDISARLIANELSKQMGQQIVIDLRPGASGVIGFEMIARAAPDGYTFGYAVFPIATNPSMYLKLPYDTAKDFQAVIHQLNAINILTVAPSMPIHSVRDLINYAQANAGKLSYGSTGAGASNQLSLELFKIMTGTQIMQISYKAIQQATTDVISGQVHLVCDNMASILPHVRAGRVRALGVTALKRSPAAPEIPTIDESGVRGYEITPWSGYIVPAGVLRNIVMRLNAEIGKALALPAVAERFTTTGYTVVGGTPEQFAEFVRAETAKWAKVIKMAGIKPQ